MTDAEFQHMAFELKKYAVKPSWCCWPKSMASRPDVCITLPDFNEATHPINGRLTTFGVPIGLARLLYNMRRIKTARMAVLGVVEKFRRRGVVEMFILQSLAVGLALGYNGAELSWTLEDNDLINRTIEKVGGRRYKTYRLCTRPRSLHGIPHAGRSQLHLRLLRRRDRCPARSVGGREPGIRRGLPRLLPSQPDSRRNRRRRRSAYLGRSGITCSPFPLRAIPAMK